MSLAIVPLNQPGSSRTGTLKDITKAQIVQTLGFEPNVEDDPDKVVSSWGFKVGEEEFGIWDYKGSHLFNSWSTCGSPEVFKQLFGNHYSTQ